MPILGNTLELFAPLCMMFSLEYNHFTETWLRLIIILDEAKKYRVQKQKDIQNVKDMCGVRVQLAKYIVRVNFQKSAQFCLSITRPALATFSLARLPRDLHTAPSRPETSHLA